MAGPVLYDGGRRFRPDRPAARVTWTGRPLVLIGSREMRLYDYQAWMGSDASTLKRLLPGVQDAFLGGGWLVRNGKPVTAQVMRKSSVSTALDPRPRAVFGVDKQGRFVLCASNNGVTSQVMARAMIQLGVTDCVLLDSGMSTCLVWRGKGQVDGTPGTGRAEARIVPHAFVVK